MEIHIFDNGENIPQPKDKIRIEQLEVTPYPDRFRVFIKIKVTPFQERPNLILVTRNDEENIVAELNIIETMHNDMEFTMHLRGIADPTGKYRLTAELFYETKNPPQDQRIADFEIPSEAE